MTDLWYGATVELLRTRLPFSFLQRRFRRVRVCFQDGTRIIATRGELFLMVQVGHVAYAAEKGLLCVPAVLVRFRGVRRFGRQRLIGRGITPGVYAEFLTVDAETKRDLGFSILISLSETIPFLKPVRPGEHLSLTMQVRGDRGLAGVRRSRFQGA